MQAGRLVKLFKALENAFNNNN